MKLKKIKKYIVKKEGGGPQQYLGRKSKAEIYGGRGCQLRQDQVGKEMGQPEVRGG